jgi:hypothetical protein
MISIITEQPIQPNETINATGHVVAPGSGFIDPHAGGWANFRRHLWFGFHMKIRDAYPGKIRPQPSSDSLPKAWAIYLAMQTRVKSFVNRL